MSVSHANRPDAYRDKEPLTLVQNAYQTLESSANPISSSRRGVRFPAKTYRLPTGFLGTRTNLERSSSPRDVVCAATPPRSGVVERARSVDEKLS